MRVLLDHNPLAPSYEPPQDFATGFKTRPAWISLAAQDAAPRVAAYRLRKQRRGALDRHCLRHDPPGLRSEEDRKLETHRHLHDQSGQQRIDR